MSGQEIILPSQTEIPFSRTLPAADKMIACAFHDGTVRFFDSTTGKRLKVFKGDANWVNDVRFSPGGKMIAFGTVEGDVNLWDRATNKIAKTFKGHFSEVRSLGYNPNGQTIAAGNFDGTITLWDISTGQELKTLSGHSGVVEQVRFSPDGQIIASVSADGKVKLWNLQTDETPKTLPCKGRYSTQTSCDPINLDVAFSSDNRTITYSGDGILTLWDIKADQEIKTIAASIRSSLSADGKIVASGVDKSGNNTVILKDALTGKILKTLSAQAGKLSPQSLSWDKKLGVPDSNSKVSHIGFSSNSKLIAVASEDHSMTVWNYKTGEKTKTFEGLTDWTGSISFSPNSKLIVTAGTDANNRERAVKLWDISTGKLSKTLIQEPDPNVLDLMVITQDVRFSPDSQTVAVVSSDSTARFWDISTGKELNIPGLTNSTELGRPRTPMEKGKVIGVKMPDGRVRRWVQATGRELEPLYWQKVLASGLTFSNDDKTFAVVNWDGVTKVRDVATGKELDSIKLNLPFASSISFNADGSRIAAATTEGVKIWNAITGKEISILRDTKKSDAWAIENLFFSPDGKTIVTADDVTTAVETDAGNRTSEWSKSIKLWDVQTSKTIETFKGQLNSANDVAFSPDNQTIAFAKTDGSIELRDFSTGQPITTLNRHLREVDLINFSPDGKMLISITGSGSSINELKLWDLTTGQEIKTYDEGTLRDIGAALFRFSSDGKKIFLFGYDKITPWNLELADLLKRGCDQVQDYPKAKDVCDNN